MHTVAMAGFISGRTTKKSLWEKLAPSMAAASSKDTGISDTKFLRISTVKGITALI